MVSETHFTKWLFKEEVTFKTKTTSQLCVEEEQLEILQELHEQNSFGCRIFQCTKFFRFHFKINGTQCYEFCIELGIPSVKFLKGNEIVFCCIPTWLLYTFLAHKSRNFWLMRLWWKLEFFQLVTDGLTHHPPWMRENHSSTVHSLFSGF